MYIYTLLIFKIFRHEATNKSHSQSDGTSKKH